MSWSEWVPESCLHGYNRVILAFRTAQKQGQMISVMIVKIWSQLLSQQIIALSGKTAKDLFLGFILFNVSAENGQKLRFKQCYNFPSCQTWPSTKHPVYIHKCDGYILDEMLKMGHFLWTLAKLWFLFYFSFSALLCSLCFLLRFTLNYPQLFLF